MRDYLKEYENWKGYKELNLELLTELEQIKEQKKEIEERFYKDLEFGTGGLRGVISAGTNRINIYTIRKATMGLANYILKQGQAVMDRGVVIAYDSRKYSREFSEEAAKVLAKNGIKVYLFNELKPTPLLSFAVRYLEAFAGIVITASHNPPEYNGYKVYNSEGGQITEKMAADIYNEIQKIEDPLTIPVIEINEALESNKIIILADNIEDEYINKVKSLLLNRELIENEGDRLSVVYTPLHGTGNKPVKNLLKEVGFKNLHIVKEQELPDYAFPTVKAPNPEEREVFALALKLANEKEADLIMATDPDADRLGVLVKAANDYLALNGNQLGALILHYILKQREEKGIIPENPILVKTIVTSELGAEIAKKYNVAVENTLTGFKYIGEKIKEYKLTGEKSFVFGYEESYGYLAGDFVRDKDAVQMTAIVAEMALYYKRLGKTLFAVLEDIYQEYGYYLEDMVSVTLKGIEGSKKIEEIVSAFRNNPPAEISGVGMKWLEDYLIGKKTNFNNKEIYDIDLPKSNVLKFILDDGSWIAVRPSGTEPKIKFYFSCLAKTLEEATERLEKLKSAFLEIANIN